MKILLKFKNKFPLPRLQGNIYLLVWAREEGRGVGTPSAEAGNKKEGRSILPALRSDMTMLLPSLMAAAPLLRSWGFAPHPTSFLKKA